MKRFINTAFMLFLSILTTEAQVTNSGNIKIAPGASVTFFGDVTNNGALTDSGTVVTFFGSSVQTIDGSSVTTFNNLTLNNSSATGVVLGQAMNVRGTMVFTDGYLVTTATNILGLTSTASVSGASNNSFVSGPVFKTGNQSFVFPTGKNVAYAPIAISAPVLATDIFTAEYFQTSPNPLYSVNSLEAGLDHVSQCEYWMLDRTTGSSDVAVTLSWDTRSCGITNSADLRVARWDGTQWTNKGNGGTTGSVSAGTIVSSAPVTGFGPFTLSSVTSENPLPLETVNFAAQCEGTNVLFTWSTVSEQNNDFFNIESSTDAMNWKTIATVKGSGYSTSQIDYSYSSVSPPDMNLYYRLKQTDFNGFSTTYKQILYLESCGRTSPENSVLVYPNPSRDKVEILTNENISSIRVYDSSGKALNGTDISPDKKHVDFSQLSEGVYVIEIVTKTQVFNQRVVITGR